MAIPEQKTPIQLAVRAVVEHDFQRASERFFNTYGRASWQELEDAMWALQALNNVDLVNELEQIGIGNWTTTLAARHRTKREA